MKSESFKHKYSVLVIDDQDNWRELLSEMLAGTFEVTSVSNFDDALQIIQKQVPPFHVVVTDMRLVDGEVGNEDGLKLIEYLNRRGDETKTILVTGYPTIASAKKALSQLAAFDYLEKHPSDGSRFDMAKFLRTVHAAAESAEKLRPQGIADVNQKILLLEPDLSQREKMETILRRDGYHVTALERYENVSAQVEALEYEYALVLISESLSQGPLLATLHRLNPTGKIILLTPQNFGRILEAMREYPVLTVFSVPTGEIEAQEFQELVHSALSSGAVKHIAVTVSRTERGQTPCPYADSMDLQAGQTYTVQLSLQDAPTPGGLGIFLLPSEHKKGRALLHLFIHGKQMKLEMGTEAYWEIPLSDERPRPLSFSITPQLTGKGLVTIEVDQNQRWSGRISLKFNVIADESS